MNEATRKGLLKMLRRQLPKAEKALREAEKQAAAWESAIEDLECVILNLEPDTPGKGGR